MTPATASHLHTISSYILVIGVLLTLVGSVGQLWMGRIKESHQRSEVVEAREIAGDSQTRAMNAESELIRLKAPRSIEETLQGSFVQRLAQFESQQFTALLASSGNDVRPLWVLLAYLLREAGWSREPPAGLAVGEPPAGILVESAPGIEVVIDQASYATSGPAAKALVEALNDVGIIATLTFARDHKENRDHIITICIGPKPH